MQDAFTGRRSFIQGRLFLGAAERTAIQDDHRGRLAALARLGAAADQCGIRADSDRDLVLLEEDQVSLLELAGGAWGDLGRAIRDFRSRLPFCSLAQFGFPAEAENPLEEANAQLIRIGGGVEAWVFLAKDGSVYKFYLPRENKSIGSEFFFHLDDDGRLLAEAGLGDYRALFQKLLLIDALGLPTEVMAVTPEGVLVAKQSFGDPLPQDADTSKCLPDGLIVIPSRFLRADRDHPRLYFLDGTPFLVADLHSRNFVQSHDGVRHSIDLVAAPFPEHHLSRDPTMADWLMRVKKDPSATLLRAGPDSEL